MTTEARMPDPIRGRWYSERDVGRLLFSLQIEPEDIDAALEQFERSEVVPDEQAIERAAEALWNRYRLGLPGQGRGMEPPWGDRESGQCAAFYEAAEAVLAAALEQTE